MYFFVDKLRKKIIKRYHSLPARIDLPGGDAVLSPSVGWEHDDYAFLECAAPERREGFEIAEERYMFDGSTVTVETVYTADEKPLPRVEQSFTKEELVEKLLRDYGLTVDDLREEVKKQRPMESTAT